MKSFVISLFLMGSIGSIKGQETIISTDVDIAQKLVQRKTKVNRMGNYEKTSIIGLSQEDLLKVSEIAHEKQRCGGYFVHETLEEARQATVDLTKAPEKRIYTTKDTDIVRALVLDVKEKNIKDLIVHLSSYQNRYYQSDTGVKAANDIRDRWSKYADAKLYPHAKWKQPSVIATITGSKYPEEVIVLGGHLDSISGFLGGTKSRAPGADDNASGIATTTEVLRIISESRYKPLRTIQFMGYAAEEVGLRGSNEIASDYKARGIKVVGVMQLDMTNFKGSDQSIFLTTDYTNPDQTEFLSKLIDLYVKVPHSKTKCGYACSDHASWTKAGYSAVFPFESSSSEMNKKIHTDKDTIDVSGSNADHAVNFAKLALAYLIEMDLQGIKISL